MALLPTPARAWRIAAVEVRRSFRGLGNRNPIQLLALGVAVLFGLAVTAAAAVGAYLAGDRLAAGDVAEPFAAATVAAAAVWVMVGLLTTYITVVQTGDVDNREGLLTTVPHRDLAGGLLVAGLLRAPGPFLPSGLIVAVAFGAGAGSPATLGLLLIAMAGVVLSAYAVGFAAGLGVKYLLGRSETVARHRVALGVLAFAAYMGLLLTNRLGALLVPLVNALRGSPVAWYADLALLAADPAASPLRAAGAVLGSGVVVLFGVVATVRIAGRLWYADPVTAGEGRTESLVAAGHLASLVGRPTAWVTRKSWLRARRGPIKLVYVAYPLILLVQPVQASIEAGRAVGTLPATLALYGAWATGAAFTLNPLGDEGVVLPVTLTTPIRGRQFVGGLVLAGVLPGLPATVTVTAVAGALSTLPPAAVLGSVVAAAVLPVGAAAVAAAVGTAFPKFDAARVTRNREVVVPSIWGFGAYSAGLFLLGSPATAAQVPPVARFVADAAGVAPVLVRVGGIALSTALIGVAAVLGYRYAVGEFEAYTMD